MLVPMARVEIIGPKSRFLDVVSLLHGLGTLHIEDLSRKILDGKVPVDQMEVDEGQWQERERLEGLLTRVRAVLAAFPESKESKDRPSAAERDKIYAQYWQEDAAALSKEVGAIVDEVESQTATLSTRQTAIDQELALLAKYEPILHKIQPLAKQIVTVSGFDSVALLIERRYKAMLDDLRDELNRITKRQCEIVSTDVDEDTTAAIVVFNKNYSDQVHKFLSMENVNQVRLPSDMADQPFDVAYDLIREKRKELPVEQEAVRKELDRLAGIWRAKLNAIRDILIDKVAEIGAIPMFGQTDYAFVMTGWVPVKNFGEMEKRLADQFGQEIIVQQLEIDEHEFAETPVALYNPAIVQPFQKILAVFGPPKYGTLDPTWFLALFYPLFFGMIVGDFGYGLVMLILAVWLRVKYKDNEMVQIGTAIFGPAATMAIFFGFLYGEFFGNTLLILKVIRPIHIGSLVIPLNREEAELTTLLIGMAVGMGFLQVCLGFILGTINGIRTKHMKHVYEKGGTLLFLVSLAMLAATAAAKIGGPVAQFIAAIGLFVGAFFAIKGGGVMGGIELIGSISNIMSYIRIMAVGLAGAIFASATNGLMIKMGNVAMAIVVGVLLHGLNIVIAIFSPTIHAMRLNFLEFFQKFYESGKSEYRPFQKTGGG